MKRITYLSLFVIGMLLLGGCIKKGDPVAEPKFGTYRFTTFTVDTFRFRVIVNGEALSDSLLSPQGLISRQIGFYDVKGNVKIIDTKTGVPVVDSAINMKTGVTTIPVVQFFAGEKPFIPPSPAETPPASGNYKIRFQYLKPASPLVPDYDSVLCIIRNNTGAGGAIIDVDSVVLSRNEISKFYEAPAGVNFRIRLKRADNGVNIATGTSSVASSAIDRSGFNTIIIRGTGTQSGSNGPYRYEYIRVY